MLTVFADSNDFVITKTGFAGSNPLHHDGTVGFIQINRGGPAVDQLIFYV